MHKKNVTEINSLHPKPTVRKHFEQKNDITISRVTISITMETLKLDIFYNLYHLYLEKLQ